MKKLLTATLLFCGIANAKPIVVAVIDTGFDFNSKWKDSTKYGLSKPKMCKFGHFDFTSNSKQVTDTHGHGTHIAGIIADQNKDVDYCLVALKYYDPNKITGSDNLVNMIRAYKFAVNLDVDVINISGGGTEYSEQECSIIKKALDNGIAVIAAAGNEASNLDEKPYYPALCDSRVIIVEATNKNGVRVKSSNYSKSKYTTYKRLGDSVLSIVPKDSYAYMTGTSQATALYTSEYVRHIASEREVGICQDNYIAYILGPQKIKNKCEVKRVQNRR